MVCTEESMNHLMSQRKRPACLSRWRAEHTCEIQTVALREILCIKFLSLPSMDYEKNLLIYVISKSSFISSHYGKEESRRKWTVWNKDVVIIHTHAETHTKTGLISIPPCNLMLLSIIFSSFPGRQPV